MIYNNFLSSFEFSLDYLWNIMKYTNNKITENEITEIFKEWIIPRMKYT